MQNSELLHLACAPIPVVRIGFIGLGRRGIATLHRYLVIDGVDIVAMGDLLQANLDKAVQIMVEKGRRIPRLYDGEDSWRRICESDDIDLVYICTDWLTHASIALYAMECGKHVAVEVPVATTVEECWQLVDKAAETKRHCVMLENCCYDDFHLSTLPMVQQGLLGELTHLEGAYIHDLRDKASSLTQNTPAASWMNRLCKMHVGNPYPTHGIGPICQLLNIHRGDRLDYLVSMSPARKDADARSPFINNTLIRTVRGKSILLQYDVTTPRPYSRMQTVCGTKGFMQKYPLKCIALDNEAPLLDEQTAPLLRRYAHPMMTQLQAEGKALGVPNLMNYAMDRRLIGCLQQGLPLDMDVFDAVEWSCLAELTEESVRKGGEPVPIPDFTRGHWDDIQGYHWAE